MNQTDPLREELHNLAAPQPPDFDVLFAVLDDTATRRVSRGKVLAAVLTLLTLASVFVRPSHRTRAWDEGLLHRVQQIAQVLLSTMENPR